MVTSTKELKKKYKPLSITFNDRVTHDKTFLLALIDDPVVTFRDYGFNSDDRLSIDLQSRSEQIRKHAISQYSELIRQCRMQKDIANSSVLDGGGNRACHACGNLPHRLTATKNRHKK